MEERKLINGMSLQQEDLSFFSKGMTLLLSASSSLTLTLLFIDAGSINNRRLYWPHYSPFAVVADQTGSSTEAHQQSVLSPPPPQSMLPLTPVEPNTAMQNQHFVPPSPTAVDPQEFTGELCFISLSVPLCPSKPKKQPRRRILCSARKRLLQKRRLALVNAQR